MRALWLGSLLLCSLASGGGCGPVDPSEETGASDPSGDQTANDEVGTVEQGLAMQCAAAWYSICYQGCVSNPTLRSKAQASCDAHFTSKWFATNFSYSGYCYLKNGYYYNHCIYFDCCHY